MSEKTSTEGVAESDTSYRDQVGKLIRRVDERITNHANLISTLQLLPALIWIGLIFGVSFAIIFVFSFFQEVPPRGVYTLTLDHYQHVLTTGIYRTVLIDSLLIGVVTTVVSFVLSFPPAYYLAVIKRKRQTLYLVLLILPFWINIVVRTLAWRQILGGQGLAAWILVDVFGVMDEFNLLFTRPAVILGLIHVFLPFMIIPMYTTLAKVDKSHIEAAQNLGANRLRAFYEVTLPQALPGIAAGVVLVFIMSAGAYVTPELLGGQSASMIANIIGRLFILVRDWGTGTSYAVIYSVIVVAMLYLFNRYVGLEGLYGGDE